MSESLLRDQAEREKRHVAFTSVLAAIGLTVLKLVVGIGTGSLGILAEAAHSGLDMVAALITYFAVRISGEPADQEHHYGHGKVENLSALIETGLLVVTCFWIIYEAVNRLFFRAVEVEASLWAFLVVLVSIVVDVNRSRMLSRAARKYKSQALEADALHFSTDIWSSAVVFLGLIGIRLSDAFPRLRFLGQADSVAAVLVAVIVLFVSWQLGKRAVMVLLDTAPPDMDARIAQIVNALPGVENCHEVRVRSSGAHIFVDMHVHMDGSLSLQEAHALTERIEKAVEEAVPNVDVTVHAEPR